jgi:hypothetical protein
LSTSALANATLTLYDSSGGTAGTVSKTNIPVNGSVRVTTSDTGFPTSNGQYSGILSSDTEVAAAVFNTNYTYKVGDTYMGIPSPSTTQTAPLIFRNHVGWTTKFHIQDASGSAQTVTVNAYKAGSSTPSDSPTFAVPANGTVTVDFTSSDFANFGSGTGSFGSAVIVGTGNLAVIVDNTNDQGGGPDNAAEVYYNGFPDSQSGRDLVAPLAFNGHAGLNTGISTINLGNIQTTLTFTYNINALYGGGVQVRTETLAANAKSTFYMPETTLTKPSYGSVQIHSSDTDVVATMTTNKLDGGGAYAYAAPVLVPSSATTKLAVPLAFNNHSAWNTGISVYSVGGAGTITAKYVRTDTVPTTAGNFFDTSKAGVANGQVSFYAPEISGMLNDFVGIVYLESTVPIMGLITTNTGGTNYVASQMAARNY